MARTGHLSPSKVPRDGLPPPCFFFPWLVSPSPSASAWLFADVRGGRADDLHPRLKPTAGRLLRADDLGRPQANPGRGAVMPGDLDERPLGAVSTGRRRAHGRNLPW